ncbi:MAG TPA: ATPase domain-containing protein, partial [Thermoplasmata archaeon]|nr:ATPase domain-containing protein [Thermoplasmata archaeon]
MALTGEALTQSEDSLAAEFEPASIRRIPTGIADLDAIVEGGFPEGSVVLLMGEEGAGLREYVYTSAAKLAIVRENPRVRSFYLGPGCDASALPEKVCYATFARSRDVVLREFAASLNEDYYRAFRRATVFRDFSAPYFRRTVVPASWTEPPSTPLGAPQENLLEGLVSFLDENGPGAMVVLDSLSDFVDGETVEAKDLVSTVKGLQRAAKRWGGNVYLLLTRDILEPRVERMIVDSVDGCLVFEWSRYLRSSKRQRYMYIEKFTSVLPH